MKNFILALSTGLLLAISWPTYGLVYFLFFAFVPLLFAEFQIRQQKSEKTKASVFFLAYASFLIWNFITTSWLYYADVFGMAFAVLVNSLLMSLVFLLYHIVAKRVNFTAAASFFIASWICFEYLHLHWEFSWPWLNLGNAFSENTRLIQWYEYTGAFGGTLWVLLVNVLILKTALLFQQHKDVRIVYKNATRIAFMVLIPIGLSFMIKWNLTPATSSLKVLAVQPNIDPYTEKYHTNDEDIAKQITDLINTEIDSTTQLILLPETVFAKGTPLANYKKSKAHLFSAKLLKEYPSTAILGGISAYDLLKDESLKSKQSNFHPQGFWYNDYNAAFFEKNQTEPTFYLKSKLVVGVENFPYQSFFRPILGDVMLDMGGTVAMKTTQKERSVFSLQNGVKIAPIICYESVYGEFVTGYVKNGANVLAIMTNDAWWGDTQGHKQHWSYAKLRAIETRKAVARSANTGISGYIDADGSVISKTLYNHIDVVEAEIPIYTKETFYVKSGDYIARVAQFLMLFIFLFAIVKFKRAGVKR